MNEYEEQFIELLRQKPQKLGWLKKGYPDFVVQNKGYD